jgi:hypothetical protein
MKTLPCAAAVALLLASAHAAEPGAQPPEPAVQRKVSEDDHVRIDELKVRGQTQSIVVQSKVNGQKSSEYLIVPASAARDPSQAGTSTGQRVWQFKF